MIKKGPLISYYERENTWNIYLEADVDMEDPHVYWCNSQYDRHRNLLEKTSFKEALDIALSHKGYPILVRARINSISREDDECYVIQDDNEAVHAILANAS
jgi:aryl-phospho-beta-D-glucosidase BglC (GH1 family)